jgi:hypothetical protein
MNPLLPGAYTFPMVQVPPPILHIADSIPLHQASMDDTTSVSGLGDLANPTSTTLTEGILPPDLSTQMIGVIPSTIYATTNNISSSFDGPNKAMSGAMSLPDNQFFFIWYSINGHDKHISWFSLNVPCIECLFRGNLCSLPRFSLGSRSYSYIITIH